MNQRRQDLEPTWRSRTPRETIAAFGDVGQRIGISRIADVTGLDRIRVPVHISVRPNSRSYTIQTGKGVTLAASYASALMEAIEVFHAERPIIARRVASYETLRNESRVVDCGRLVRLESSLFRDDLEIEWVEAIDLTDQRVTWVPFELVHTNYSLPYDTGAGCFARSTTGLASGNHGTEAIIHAIAEVVERDAMTLWASSSAAARAATRIDLASIESTAILLLVSKIEEAGLELVLSDLTNDFRIPVAHASILDANYGAPCATFSAGGCGCHPLREVAVLRAITEAVQSRLVLITGVRDNIFTEHYELPHIKRGEADVLRPATTPRRYEDLPDHRFENLTAMLGWLLGCLEGYPVLAVDLSRPEFAVPVVRVIIPGLEDGADTPGYVPGPRLVLRALSNMLDAR